MVIYGCQGCRLDRMYNVAVKIQVMLGRREIFASPLHSVGRVDWWQKPHQQFTEHYMALARDTNKFREDVEANSIRRLLK